MSQLFNSELFVRYSWGDKEVEISWSPKVSWEDAWALAHSMEDGLMPRPPIEGTKEERDLYSHALRIREVESKWGLHPDV